MPAFATMMSTAPPFHRRARHHFLDLRDVRHIRAVRYRLSTGLANFFDHGFRRAGGSAAAVARCTEVIDHDLCAEFRKTQRVRAAKARTPRR